MFVEVLAAMVVDGGRAGVGVSSGYLHFAERDSGIEGSHDERRSEHVGVDEAESGSLADGPHPPVGGAPVQRLAVVAHQDWPRSPFPEREIHGTRRAGDERNDGWIVALAEETGAGRSMAG